MARTANPTTRPPASITAGVVASAEQAREMLEAANHALVTARAVLWCGVPDAPGLALPVEGVTEEVYSLALWIDEDVLQLELVAWLDIDVGTLFPFDDNAATVSITDGTTTWTTTAISPGSPSGSVTFTPAHPSTSGLAQVQLFWVSVTKVQNSDPTYLREVLLRVPARAATTLPAPGEP